jgi:two-component system, response regulator YesN
MYSVMLVDDDLPVLEFLAGAVDWTGLGFRLAGTFQNPLEALAAAGEVGPDVLITDIGMPEMDGIELIRVLRTEEPGLKTAILSCHDEFGYAQLAVKLGVSEYVLKETMTAKTITELLTRLKKELDGEAVARHKSRELEQSLRRNRSDLKRIFLRNTLGGPLLDPAEWSRQAAEYGVEFSRGTAYVPVLGFPCRMREALRRFQTRELLVYTAENIAEELLAPGERPEHGKLPDNGKLPVAGEAVVFSLESGELVLLFPHFSQLHINNRQRMEDTLRKLQQCLLQFGKTPFTFVTGTPVADGKELREVLNKEITAAQGRFYWPEASILRLEHLQGSFGSGDLLLAEYVTALEEFRRAVLEEQAEQVEAFIAKWLAFIQYHRFNPVEVKEWLLKIILDIRMRLKSLQHYQSSYASEVLHHDVMELTSLGELEGWLRSYMLQAVEWAGQVYQESKNREIMECQRYVSVHWNERITLEDAARHLHLHPNYLSRLFKRETGENFVEFATRVKMDKARELLKLTDKTVEDISLLLGYDNKQYFTKLFKTHTGQLPSAFRLQKDK